MKKCDNFSIYENIVQPYPKMYNKVDRVTSDFKKLLLSLDSLKNQQGYFLAYVCI